jgi:hypothetical protein
MTKGTRKEWGVSVTPRPLFTPGKDPVPIVQEAGWAPGPVWKGAENLAPPTGIQSPERPARSQSLHRLSYPAHVLSLGYEILYFCNKTEKKNRFMIFGRILYIIENELLTSPNKTARTHTHPHTRTHTHTYPFQNFPPPLHPGNCEVFRSPWCRQFDTRVT